MWPVMADCELEVLQGGRIRGGLCVGLFGLEQWVLVDN